jgi:ABC-2 type transport system permease protein
MRLFFNLARLSFQRQLTYRTAILAGLATNLFFGLLRASVLIALYGLQTDVSGISLQGAITYTGLTQAMIAFISLFGWYDLMNTVYRGDIASDLLKPFDYFTYWLALDLGRALASLLLRGLALMAFFALFFRISLPGRLEQWLALVLALLLALLNSFAWRFLVNLASFWTPNALGIGRFAFGMALFFSGFIMPLRFFPPWFGALASFTPFPSMVNTVVEVYLGVLTGPDLALALLTQLGWFIGLAALGQLVLRAGVRTLVIQGG